MKAVVFDKWLHSMGGGEIVACNIARLLKDMNYNVIFVSGKIVPKKFIWEKLKIDSSGIKYTEVWNDEQALKKIVFGSDIFINTSFMDYSRGFAKKNIYYTHFPTQPYDNLGGMIFTKLVIPVINRVSNPLESMNLIDAQVIINKTPAFRLEKENKFAISELSAGKIEVLEFKLVLENFYLQLLENIQISLENGQITEKEVRVLHHDNILSLKLKILPNSQTVYLNISIKDLNSHYLETDKVYLLYPKVQLSGINNPFLSRVMEKANNRIRAGIFTNTIKRLDTYQTILANSYFTKKWINSYWHRSSRVAFPPVSMLFHKYRVKKIKKKNWICSVGRFFTLGHGKKQEILIEAFKKMYNLSSKKWELHLVGGLGGEQSSFEFFKYLKEISKGYPIFFHVNIPRYEVENIYLKSKIYWHATGFGEKENYRPVRFEHFGIAPIEAISAGCLPVLYKGGGLKEIVSIIGLNPKLSFFSSIEELINNTSVLADIIQEEFNWDDIFNILDQTFSVKSFRRSFQNIISE